MRISDDDENIYIYNTLSNSRELFEPIDESNIGMYVCGPTVYSDAHIGNARPVIVFDILYRLLRYKYGKESIKYVRNITDVDDKINKLAIDAYPYHNPNDAIKHFTGMNIEQFHKDTKVLGCLSPNEEPKVSEHMCEITKMISRLINLEYAYVICGERGQEILMDVSKIGNFGVLSNRKIKDMRAGNRMDTTSDKRNFGDFVLWKESGLNEPSWKFNPGDTMIRIYDGRPGWHIECSAMAKHYLGDTFDIHGGGVDLVFPHHENEIAQSCCANDTDRMANYFVHNGTLKINGNKMSKSNDNFYTINELLNTKKFGDKKWSGQILRLAMLMTHYRTPIDFNISRLEEASNIIRKWKYEEELSNAGEIDGDILSALRSDLNTPLALRRLQSMKNDENFSKNVKFLGLQQS